MASESAIGGATFSIRGMAVRWLGVAIGIAAVFWVAHFLTVTGSSAGGAGVSGSAGLPRNIAIWVSVGVGFAWAAGVLGVRLLARGATVPVRASHDGADRVQADRVQADRVQADRVQASRAMQSYVLGMASHLVVQTGALIVGLVLAVAISEASEKFSTVAAFGLSFAVIAGGLSIAGSLAISRFLQQRSGLAQNGASPRATPSLSQTRQPSTNDERIHPEDASGLSAQSLKTSSP